MARGVSLHVLRFICTIMFIGLKSSTIAAPSRRSKPCGNFHSSGSNREARIVGGTVAEEGEFPWMVSFKSKHGHFCAGTVISESATAVVVMSAAHCFHQNEYLEYKKDGSVNLNSLNVTLGEYSLKNTSENYEVVRHLKRIYLHPKYDPVSKQNDIALIKIAKRLSFAQSVVPVCLPGKSDDSMWKKNAKATVVGWGKIRHSQDYYDWLHETDALRKVTVKIWDKDECIDKYKGFPKFPSNSFLCAGEQGKESCTGDSGGPILSQVQDHENSKWVVIGIVANGNKCGAYGRPGVYTLVSDFLQWIEAYTI